MRAMHVGKVAHVSVPLKLRRQHPRGGEQSRCGVLFVDLKPKKAAALLLAATSEEPASTKAVEHDATLRAKHENERR